MICRSAWASCGGIFDVDTLKIRLEELDQKAANPELWQNPEASAKLQKEKSRLETVVNDVAGLEKRLSDALELLDLAAEDAEIAAEVDRSIEQARQGVESLELRRMLGEDYDDHDALVSVNAGAGGTESQDWAQMLMRMLLRWAERHEFTVEMLDQQYGEEAGIKSVSFAVRGPYAYGYLKGESGVHRLVRISPFDAQKRRHTSFASVAVAPEVDDDIEVELNEEDVRVDTYRASGAGGQHVNKTDSAVRMTHEPTGIVVACQAERSQHKNRARALRMLKAKLFEIELRRREEEQAKVTGEKKKIEWGSQIRSYVLHPYRMVKDHRTNFEKGNADAVLDGELDAFIESYLLSRAQGADQAAS